MPSLFFRESVCLSANTLQELLHGLAVAKADALTVAVVLFAPFKGGEEFGLRNDGVVVLGGRKAVIV